MRNRSTGQRVAVILPAYNEGQVISTVITALQAHLDASKIKYEIIVVDDSSRDDTALIALQQGAHTIRHLYNTGSGGATATGLRYAAKHNFSLAATFDADGQHDPADLVNGITTMRAEGGDLLIGSRLFDPQGMPALKILGNKCLSYITSWLFGVRVTDSQSGLRIFSEQALHNLRWKTSGYEFCSEMIWRARQLGLQVGEFPISSIYTEYSTLKGQNNWNGLIILKSLLKCRVFGLFNE